MQAILIIDTYLSVAWSAVCISPTFVPLAYTVELFKQQQEQLQLQIQQKQLLSLLLLQLYYNTCNKSRQQMTGLRSLVRGHCQKNVQQQLPLPLLLLLLQYLPAESIMR